MLKFIVCDDDNDSQFSCSMDECLDYILKRVEGNGPGLIQINKKGLRLPVDKILYVESNGHKITYHITDLGNEITEYRVYGKLNDAEKSLNEYGFFRVHQSYLVNMNYVRGVERYTVYLTDKKSVPVSKSRYKNVEKEFERIRRFN